jgi:glycosyltransferase involved in cell wall biosynthesis
MESPSGAPQRTLVVVPAFNEAATVGRVVAEVRALPQAPDVVVVDDGSSDGTGAGVDARIVRLPFNCGIGAAVQTGLRLALADGYDLVARLDGDGQHDARVLPALLAVIETGQADFVVGSRYVDREGFQSSMLRRIGSRWFRVLLRLACGQQVSDPTSGLWAANRRAAALLAVDYASDYPEVDALVLLARSGCRIVEVPTVMRERTAGTSSINAPRALYYMLKVTVALGVGSLRPRVLGRS